MSTGILAPRPGAEITPVVLRARDAARLLGISETTLWNWVANNPSFPKPIKLSPGTTVWRIDELDSWLMRRPRVETAPGGAADG